MDVSKIAKGKKRLPLHRCLSRVVIIPSEKKGMITTLEVQKALTNGKIISSFPFLGIFLGKKCSDIQRFNMIRGNGLEESIASQPGTGYVHNFENDILVASRNIAKRYSSGKNHIAGTTDVALDIFDSTRKIHGMGKRERLLLQIAVLLHDCGKYISMSEVAECSYRIIMATEIIGLSTEERQVIASAVRYNTREFGCYKEINRETSMSRENYLLTAKLTAILRLANAMDRSHYQKVKALNVTLKDRILYLVVDSARDVSLELGLLKDKKEFFEEVFGIRLVMRRKGRR